MRGHRILVLAFSCIAGAASPASAQSFTVVGNNVEMFLNRSCISAGFCVQLFPQNNTGRIVKIGHVSCEIILDGVSNKLIFTSIGPAVSPSNTTLLKKSFFETHRIVSNIDNTINYLSTAPGIMLGVGRYLAVEAQPNGGQVQMKCAATGIFAN
jgi:hypothetical protein